MSEAEEIAETFAAASVTNEVQLHSLGLGKLAVFEMPTSGQDSSELLTPQTLNPEPKTLSRLEWL